MASSNDNITERVVIREQVVMPQTEADTAQPLDFDKFLRPLRTHWLAILLSTLLGGLLAFAWTLTQSKVYEANATGLVTAGKAETLAQASSGDMYAKSRAKSYLELARSRPVAEGVINELQLDTTPDALIGRITVANQQDTVNIRVSATGPTPKDAKSLADTWVKVLGQQIQKIENEETVPLANGTDGPSVVKLVPSVAAGLPGSPIYPNPRVAIPAGLLLGLGAGLGYSFLRSRSDTRIRSRKAIEQTFAEPVLGVIPKFSESTLVSISNDPNDSASKQRDNYTLTESFRELRTNLRYSNVDNPPRTIVVTSPTPGDGKSSTIANLSITLAAAGQRVVVIDCDLRRPMLANRFGLVPGAGLTEVLSGQAELADVLQPYDENGDILVLSSGKLPPNPAELLQSKAMLTLVNSLAEEAIVLLDSPPLLPVNDAAALTASCDGALVVVSANKSTTDELGDALRVLGKVDGKVLGIIINRVPTESADSKYYGYYGSYYRYESADSEQGSGSKKKRRAPSPDGKSADEVPAPAGPGA